jgi:two-component system, cell cycle sensor histidine kinase and response regulator CckA
MAAQVQPSEPAEVTHLREKVSQLERRLAELSRVEKSLGESRDLFDSFMGRIPALAWMKDEDGRYRYANRGFLDLMGELQATILGSSNRDLWPPDIATGLRSRDQKAIASQGAHHSLEVFRFPAGERHFRVVRFPFVSRDRMKYCGAIAFDITERIRLEQELKAVRRAEEADRSQIVSMLASLRSVEARGRHLFESPVTGMMLCEGETILDINQTLLNWLGYDRSEIPAVSKRWSLLSPARYHAADTRALAQLRASGGFAPFEKELVMRSGAALPVLVAGLALESPSTEYLCFVLNISERRQIEERLLRSQKLESLGLISGGVAHDFNNLLATILGNSSLASDAISREHPAFRPLCEVQMASRRASELTQQMLAYAGRASFSIQPVDVSTTIREIGSLLETTISKKVTLKLDLAPGLPVVDGNEGQLQQIIMNLVINASEAIGENPGEIRVSTRLIDGAGNAGVQRGGRSVALEVKDTGCGMSEETRARIFDPFFTTKTNGRGIGLATVLSIVRNHSGALLVESELGHGTTFRVVLPAGEAQPSPPPRAENTASQSLSGSETILVADDDEGIRRMNRAALERFGYKVLLACDGAEAVKLFRERPNEIAVVLLDWAMPVMNGDEALLRILEIDPCARVLMSSGYAETGTLRKGGEALIAGFVQKPYTTTQIIDRLRRIIDSTATPKSAPAGISAAAVNSTAADS